MDEKVGIWKTSKIAYPGKENFFRPSERYPELQNAQLKEISTEENKVFEVIRNTFIMLGYDKENIGTEHWNPLRTLVYPGNKVVIKPNMVMHVNGSGEGEDCLYTHPSVVCPIIDYCILAMTENGQFKGQIVVGDAPMQECDFELLVKNSGYDKLLEFYKGKGINIVLHDFRNVKTIVRNGVHIKEKNEQNGIVVNLDEASNFFELPKKRLKKLRVTNYDPHILQKHHNVNTHVYKVAKELLEADVIINMPKPKTHRKAGVTIALKNMVGISANKEYLPHHTNGSKKEGGDAYLEKNIFFKLSDYFLDKKNSFAEHEKYVLARASRFIAAGFGFIGRKLRKDYREGSWYGNDTIWRTIYDLNNIVFLADSSGQLGKEKCRRMLVVADMIVSGEKDGPLNPSRKDCGVVAVGENPALFDEAICAIMGFDIKSIPTLNHLRENKRLLWLNRQGQAMICSNNEDWNGKKAAEITSDVSLNFVENPGWKKDR